MTGKESKSFVWGSEASAPGSSNFAGTRGYLVFALGASAADVGTTQLVGGVTQFTATGRVRVPHQSCQSSALLAPEVPAYVAPVTTRDAAGNISVQRLTAQLTGAAFQVTTATADVQYVPTIPGALIVNDFVTNAAVNPNNSVVAAAPGPNGQASNTVDIVKMGPDDLIAVAGAVTTLTAAAPGFPALPTVTNPANIFSLNAANIAQAAIPALTAGPVTEMSLRYFIDANKAAGGNDTRLVFWSTGDQRGTYSVNAFDNAQNRSSVNLNLLRAELDVVNPETSITALPSTFVDGFIEYTPFVAPNSNGPANVLVPGAGGAAVAVDPKLSTLGGSSFTYSTIISQAFGAVQTILGAHRNR